MKESMLIIIGTIFLLMIGVVCGILIEKTNKQPEIITSEIHLIIPKDDSGLKKQWLHVSCQKTMLEEIIKWDDKQKSKKTKGD